MCGTMTRTSPIRSPKGRRERRMKTPAVGRPGGSPSLSNLLRDGCASRAEGFSPTDRQPVPEGTP